MEPSHMPTLQPTPTPTGAPSIEPSGAHDIACAHAAVLHANDKTNGDLKRSDACAHVPAHAGAQWPSFDTPHGLADDDDAADAPAGMRRWRV